VLTMARAPLCVAVLTASAVLASVAPVFAETYTTPANAASVGTDRSDATGVVAVSHGGCASGNVAVAVGDNGRCPTEAQGWELAVGLFGAEALSGEWAVSDTGSATSCTYPYYCTFGLVLFGASVSGTGAAGGGAEMVAASGTGPAEAYIAASGTGGADGGIAGASGRGDATAARTAVSGTGDATTDSGWLSWSGTPGAGVAVAGDDATTAGAGVAVALTGDATTGGATWLLNPLGLLGQGIPVPVGGVAVAGGNANAQGGAVAVSATGDARGGRVLNVGGDCGC
jgi:hypothetical protein